MHVLPNLARFQRIGATWVVLAAGQLAVQFGYEQHSLAVLFAIGVGTHLAVGRRLFPALVALMPRTLPTA